MHTACLTLGHRGEPSDCELETEPEHVCRTFWSRVVRTVTPQSSAVSFFKYFFGAFSKAALHPGAQK